MNARRKVRNFLYEQESFEIRGACFSVWNSLGSAFKESAVDNALTHELKKRGLEVEDQKRIAIMYDGKKRADSSTAEQLSYTQLVPGSNPGPPTTSSLRTFLRRVL